MRGFVSGVIWGLLFSALVGATISLVQGRAERDKAETAEESRAPAVSQAPETEMSTSQAGSSQDSSSQDNGGEAADQSAETGQTDTPAMDGTADSGANSETGQTDQTGQTDSEQAEAPAPDSEPAAMEASPQEESSVDTPETPASAPAQQPADEGADNTPQTPVPATPDNTNDNTNDSGSVIEPAAEPNPQTAKMAAPSETPPQAAVDTAELPLPRSDGEGAPQMAATDTETSTTPLPEARQPQSPQSEPAPMVDTGIAKTPQVNSQIAERQENPAIPADDTAQAAMNRPEAGVEAQPLPKAPKAPDTTEPPQIEVTQTAPEPESPLRVPVPRIRSLAPNVETNRLPTIGGDTQEAQTEKAGAASPSTGENGASSDTPALSAYAVPFANPDAKPLFSIILIDDPDYPLSDKALSRLPFALSFAIDASREDAAELAARYRTAGFEVLMLTNLPKGAGASDVEVAFESYARTMPESVAVLDRDADAKVARQLAGILSERGMGLVTPSKGLNSAQKAAKREGVPAALVYRQIDEEDENPSVIRRYLDRAAFRAAQEGHVIMLGRTRPETIEALVLWALEDRAASVAIAPVSAVLKGL